MTIDKARDILLRSEYIPHVERKARFELQRPDVAYNAIVQDVVRHGQVIRPDEERTGTGTIKRFGVTYAVDVRRRFPILTTKEVNFSSVVAEYLWFLSGSANVEKLREHTSIWDEWADEDGNVETAYGRYWRRFPFIPVGADLPGEATTTHEDPQYSAGGIDQIKTVVRNIKENPHSRRHHVTAWHPDNALKSKLPPCHHSFTFNVSGEKLHIEVHQRSGDLALGVPFNMAGYALILNLVARETGYEPGVMKHNITDAHIYLPHLEKLVEQVQRTPMRRHPNIMGLNDPVLRMPDKSLFDLSLDDVEDFSLDNYEHHDAIRYEVAV